METQLFIEMNDGTMGSFSALLNLSTGDLWKEKLADNCGPNDDENIVEIVEQLRAGFYFPEVA